MDKTWEKKVTLITQDIKNGKRTDVYLIHIILLSLFFCHFLLNFSFSLTGSNKQYSLFCLYES